MAASVARRAPPAAHSLNDELRTQAYLGAGTPSALIARGFLHAAGFSDADLTRPFIGVCNTWSEFNPCHGHFRSLADAVKRGITRAGGTPIEFNAFSIHENLTALHGTPLMYRNFLAMEVEELLLTQPLDGAVLLGGCDKTIPALLMGAASADLPSLVLAGGPSVPGRVRGRRVGCWDVSSLWQDVRAGRAQPEELDELVLCMNGSVGTCDVMGTASTAAALAEALGMALPGTALIPAVDPRRLAAAEASGRQAVDLARRQIRPSAILTEPAFENAIRVLHALGGSTNGVLHLLAIARHAGVSLSLDTFDKLARSTPFLVNVFPSGEHWTEQFDAAGGVPALLHELAPLLNNTALAVTGGTIGEGFAAGRVVDRSVVASLEDPLQPQGGLAVLTGNLAPEGALIKVSAADKTRLRHTGRARVFESREAAAAMLGNEEFDVNADDVLVLRNQGPVGYPGMPHSGDLAIPVRLRRRGVRDMVRISDATVSGTRGGSLIVHVSPESATGGPLGLVRDGDLIEFDVEGRKLEVLVKADDLSERRREWRRPAGGPVRGYPWLYTQHVLQAHEGCDFDFLGPGPQGSVSGGIQADQGAVGVPL